ncbi:clavesin-2-like [Phlebotomus argentipes]|uniref:clavesin-2-like n=1 Tax=Phlebotomus argentipes TaxID=94469 RepID=UPI002892E4BE|nr:clavesin-2-like [Phlebotomus argentipes]XP_059616590.1 clavesin-2-like [Phlebotomus argentipes]
MSEYFEFQWDMRSKISDVRMGNKKYYNVCNEPTEWNQALFRIKELIGASMDYALKDKSCYHDNDFLLRFLFARKFDVDEAFRLIINYFTYLQKNHALFQRLSVFDESVQLALRDGFPGVLPERDRRGRKVLVFFTANWEPALYSLLTVYRAMLLSLEKLLEDKQNQANGFVAIVDWSNLTLQKSSHLNPKILKLIIEGLQDCFPVQFKAIHFIGQAWYLEAAMAVIRQFLKEKTRSRIKLHSNLSTLHESIARDVLPTELGGEGPPFNPLEWYHKVLESSQETHKIESRPYYITQATVYTTAPASCLKNGASMAKKSADPARNSLLSLDDD